MTNALLFVVILKADYTIVCDSKSTNLLNTAQWYTLFTAVICNYTSQFKDCFGHSWCFFLTVQQLETQTKSLLFSFAY